VLAALESPLNTLVTPAVHAAATQNPYTRLQKWLMLGEYEKEEREMVHTIQTHYRPAQQQHAAAVPAVTPSDAAQSVNYTYLLFAFHIYLYLHPRAPHPEPLNASGVFLCHALLEYLESQPSQHALVPAYAQYLSPPARVAFYVRFLQRIPSLAQRQALLAAFAEYCPEQRLEVTRNLVSNILGDDTDDPMRGVTAATSMRPLLTAATSATEVAAGQSPAGPANLLATAAGAGGVSAADLAKITAIDCFDVSGGVSAGGAADVTGVTAGASVDLTVVQTALVQVTQLYRAFVAKEKYAAAKRFTEHLQAKHWDQHIFNIIQQHQQQHIQCRNHAATLSRPTPRVVCGGFAFAYTFNVSCLFFLFCVWLCVCFQCRRRGMRWIASTVTGSCLCAV